MNNMFYILLTPTRTAQDPGLEDKYVFIFVKIAADLVSILLLLYYSSSAASFLLANI